jgi:2-hydroxyacyl-CoA lyase
MSLIKGARVVPRALLAQGIGQVFGVLGYPINELAFLIQQEGLTYIGTRHEQAAGAAAQATSYLRRHVGCALTVSGPGMTNAITAMGNAQANGWPLLVLSGASDLRQAGMGAFQEAPQVLAASPWCKWAGAATRVEDIPRLVAHAVRQAWYGRPGAVYLDLPGDVLDAEVDEAAVRYPPPVPPPPRAQADPALIAAALAALRSAERPLAIVGKGAVWADAAPELRRLMDETGLPFLPSPMGKGVVPDDHPASVAACRSYALQQADLIVLLGSRLNWIMHFGQPPRFAAGARLIQIDAAPEELGANLPATVGIAADLKAAAGQLVAALEREPWRCPADGPWRSALREQAASKQAELRPGLESDDVPMGFYRPLAEIQRALPPDATVIAEGSNTMDISRSVIEHSLPGHRLDAGTWGTMGLGSGFALGAALARPGKRVVALLGDSAFGFDAMEVEVAVRYKLPITWIVFVNGGVLLGAAELPKEGPPAPFVFTPGARYDRVMEAFGGQAWHCETPQQVAAALREALAAPGPSLLNLAIHPHANRAPQSFGWLTR